MGYHGILSIALLFNQVKYCDDVAVLKDLMKVKVRFNAILSNHNLFFNNEMFTEHLYDFCIGHKLVVSNKLQLLPNMTSILLHGSIPNLTFSVGVIVPAMGKRCINPIE